MSLEKEEYLDDILAHRKPRIAIETGTYRGATTLLLAQRFEAVYTIELSRKAHDRTARALASVWNIHQVHGDSTEHLPQLDFDEAIFYYLDAHHCPGNGLTANTYPIWSELEFIRTRKYADVVLVDDVHAFGRPEGWSNVTAASLEQFMRPASCRTIGDQFVMWMIEPECVL